MSENLGVESNISAKGKAHPMGRHRICTVSPDEALLVQLLQWCDPLLVQSSGAIVASDSRLSRSNAVVTGETLSKRHRPSPILLSRRSASVITVVLILHISKAELNEPVAWVPWVSACDGELAKDRQTRTCSMRP